MKRLRTECQKAKIILSSSDETVMEIFLDGEEYPVKITRALFEDICNDLFQRCLAPV